MVQGGQELGDEPNLPTDITLFLADGMAPEQSSTPSSPSQLPTPTKAPSTAMPQQEGPSLKFHLYHPKVNPTLNPKQGQEEGSQIS